MKKIIILVSIVFLFSISFAQEKYKGQTIEQILELPEEQIDLGVALLVLAKDAYPKINIDFFDYALDFMANGLNQLMQGRTEPEARIAMMNTYLYRPGWWNDSLTFTYDLDDLEASKTDNQFLNGYLATKKGSCVTMPMLHIVLADRLNWPIHAVRSPKHIFCRYIDDNLKDKNIESTCGGGFISDERYIDDVNIPEKPIKNGVYLRTLSKKEYIASMMMNNARYFHEKKNDLEKAIYYTSFAASIDSTLSGSHWNLNHYFYLVAHEIETEMIEKTKNIENAYSAQLMAVNMKAKEDIYTPKPPSPFDYQNKRKQETMIKPTNPFQTGLPSIVGNENIGSTILPKQNNGIRNNNFNQMMNELQFEMIQEIENLRGKYVPAIKEALARSDWHKSKAEELGIVLKFPEEFFIKQSESIEKFKRTGEY